jgi:hypothetical protein
VRRSWGVSYVILDMPSRWETTNLMVGYDTPLGQIETLRQRLKSYVANNNREWSNADIHIDKMPYQNEIHLIVAMERMYPLLTSPVTRLSHFIMQIARIGRTGEDVGHVGPSSCAT